MAKNPFQNFVVRFHSGDTVFDEGDTGATMFIVQSGAVRLFREIEDQRRDLGVMEKGDFFGEMSILEGLPRTHSAEAVDDAELIEKIWGARYLARLLGERMVGYLDRLSVPVRAGTHNNTAYAMAHALDYARAVGDESLHAALHAADDYGHDEKLPHVSHLQGPQAGADVNEQREVDAALRAEPDTTFYLPGLSTFERLHSSLFRFRCDRVRYFYLC